MPTKPPPHWGDTEIEDILHGDRPAEQAREADRKGLTGYTYAALKAADRTRRIEAKLDELAAPPAEGQDRIAQLLDLLSALAEAQLRTEAKLDTLLLGPIASASRAPRSRPGFVAPSQTARSTD